MKNFDTILICLDLSEKDESLLKYASGFMALGPWKRVVFFHCLKEEYDVPENLESERQSEEECSHVRTLIEEKTASFCQNGSEAQSEIVVSRGSPLENALLAARKYATDLIICGKSQRNKPHDVLPVRVLRKSPCSLLLVPSGSRPQFNRLLVAVDESAPSSLAVEIGVNLAEKATLEKLHLMRACEYRIGNQKLWLDRAGIVIDVKDQLRRSLESFVSKYSSHDLEFEYIIRMNIRPSEAIRALAKEKDFDLVIMGSKGRGMASATLLGSTAERVVRQGAKPMLIVKEKGETSKLLKFLMGS